MSIQLSKHNTIPPLKQAVDDFRSNEITAMLRLAGISTKEMPKKKVGKVALWTRLLGDPARIRQSLARLTPRCRKALQQLQMVGGHIRTSRYRHLLERAGIAKKESQRRPSQPSWYRWRSHPEDAKDPTTPDEIIAALLKNGLIWSYTPDNLVRDKLGFTGGHYIYIPQEIAVHLPPPPERECIKPNVAYVLPGSARTFQRDIYLLWSTARETPLQVTNAGLLRVSDLRRVAGQLLVNEKVAKGTKESDFRRIYFLRRLLIAQKLLRVSPTAGPHVLEAVPDPHFLHAEATERVRTCFQSWRDGTWWNELWLTYVVGKTRASRGLTDPAPREVVSARQDALNVLAHLVRKTGAEWIALDDIANYLQDHNEGFLVDRETADTQQSYYYSSSLASPYRYNSLGWVWETYERDEQAGWNGVETVFIRAVLTEGLFWLGLADLGYAHPQTPAGGTAPSDLLAVRLTAMGRWLLLGEHRPVVPSESGHVVVQPNFHVFAFDPIPDGVLATLNSFATRLNAERAIEYEITHDSVYRAQLAGQNVSEIKAWLETTTGAPLPQNVARSLDEWQAAFERIVIRPRVGWVKATRPELIDTLLDNPKLRRAIIKRTDATSLLVRPEKVDALEHALLLAGELPIRTDQPEDARQASLAIDSSGVIRFAHGTPNLYTYGYLCPFADQEDDHWRISAASVRRARQAGINASHIIAELETMALGGVPAELQTRIKAWAKHYGDASVQTVTLIQFRDQQALDDLLADPEIRPYLKPFKPRAKLGLAVIKLDNLEKIRELLALRGVELRSA